METVFPRTSAPASLSRVTLERRAGLLQRRLERPTVKREELLTGLDVITLLEVDRRELAGDLRPDRNRGVRLDSADDAHLYRHLLADRRCSRYGDARRRPVLLRRTGLALRARSERGRRAQHEPENETTREGHSAGFR